MEPTNMINQPRVVRIGAVAELNSFFEVLSQNIGVPSVGRMHLQPTHESNTVGLLQKHTQIPLQKLNRRVNMEPQPTWKEWMLPPGLS
jgi:hypothetical protein